MQQRGWLNALPKGFAAFTVVGGIGFIVDASILATLVHIYDWGDYTARLISFAVAVSVTWYLNRSYVFSDAKTDFFFCGTNLGYAPLPLISSRIQNFCEKLDGSLWWCYTERVHFLEVY